MQIFPSAIYYILRVIFLPRKTFQINKNNLRFNKIKQKLFKHLCFILLLNKVRNIHISEVMRFSEYIKIITLNHNFYRVETVTHLFTKN